MSLPDRGLIERPGGVGGSAAELELSRLEGALEKELATERLVKNVKLGLRAVSEPFVRQIVELASDLDSQARRARDTGRSTDFEFSSYQDKVKKQKEIVDPTLLQRMGINTTETAETEVCTALWYPRDEEAKKWGSYELHWFRDMATGLVNVDRYSARVRFGHVNPDYIFEGDRQPTTVLSARLYQDPKNVDDWEYGHRLWQIGLSVSPAVAWNEETGDEPPYEITIANLEPDLTKLIQATSLTPAVYNGGSGLERISFDLDLVDPSFTLTNRFDRCGSLKGAWVWGRNYDERYSLRPETGEVFEQGKWDEIKKSISAEGLQSILETLILSGKF